MDQRNDESTDTVRRPYRPPIGIPSAREPRTPATVASIVLHALFALIILAPTLFVSARFIDFQPQGAGGAGPAGGGGGGNRGGADEALIRSAREQLNYLRVAPEPERPRPPEEKKPLDPVKPPPPPVPEPPKPEPAAQLRVPAVDSAALAAVGTGSAGSGTDGSTGNGAGSGGGVGSGVGTGRGSGNGPGTGGGEDTVYPPTVVALPILPLPIPSRVRPYRMVAQFDVDTLGNATLITFNPSRDAGYNRRIREMLQEIRFRPAVRVDGRPVRALAVVTAEAM
jgi:protein TonB